MNPVLKNIFAVIVGVIIGSAANMGIVMISGHIIPPPTGVDVTNMDSLKASLHLFKPIHFLFPFLAHALGTLGGALGAAFVAATHRMRFAFGIGIFFLMGGITSILMLPSPVWFAALDLIVAYLPMGWLGGKIAIAAKKQVAVD
mgnify:CR=1 FL=1